MKRIISLLIATALLTACSGGGKTTITTPSAEPTLDPTLDPTLPRELNIVASRFEQHVDWDQMYVWQKMEEDTGIKVNWEYIPSSAIEEQRNLRVSTNNLPDVFYGCRWTAQEMAQYGTDGIFVPLDPYLETSAPNVTRLYNDMPDVKQAMILSDGHIYGFPLVYVDKLVGTSMLLRESWMTESGLALPKTPYDVLDIMKAMKAKDPKRLVYSDYEDQTAYAGLIQTLNGAWGLGNRGGGNGYFDANPDDTTKVRFWATSDRFKEVLALIRDMYNAGCIDPDSLTQNEVAWGAKSAQKDPAVIGVVTNDTLSAYNAENDYVGTGILTGPYGDNLWASVRLRVSRNANYVVTKACKNVPLAVEFADYWMDNADHTVMFFNGEEGNHWNWNDAHTLRIPADWQTNDPEGRSLDQMRSTWTSQPGGSYFGVIQPLLSLDTSHNGQVADSLVKPYLPSIVWPTFSLTLDELKVSSSTGVDILTHYEESVTSFITGKLSLETDWDKYVKTFDDMGLKDLVKVYQDAYDRYLAAGGKAS